MLTVRFLSFWPDFVPEESIFYACLSIITKSSPKIVKDPNAKVDIEIESVFPKVRMFEHFSDRLKLSSNLMSLDRYTEKYRFRFSRNRQSVAKKRIWYTSENLRPPHNIYDLTLSFDVTDQKLRNLYFPFWMYRVDWGIGNVLTEISPKPYELTRSRDIPSRFKNMCTFSSTREPSRLRLLSIINDISPLDKFGTAFENRVNSKKSVSEEYKIQICPENSFTPGYVTEKLQESWAVGNLPLWQGAHIDQQFNKDSFINLLGMNSLEIIDRISSLEEEEIKWITSQPLLNYEPSIENLLEAFRQVLEI
jgi:hypothetical protein